MKIRRLMRKIVEAIPTLSLNSNNTYNNEVTRELSELDRRKQYIPPVKNSTNAIRFMIVRREDSTIIYALNDLTDAVNNLINSGWMPIGSPSVKRDSTAKSPIFVAFQAAIKEK